MWRLFKKFSFIFRVLIKMSSIDTENGLFIIHMTYFWKNRYARFVELDARNIFKKKIESKAYSYVNKWPKQDWCFFRAKTILRPRGSNPAHIEYFLHKKSTNLISVIYSRRNKQSIRSFFKNAPRIEFYKSRITVFSKMRFSFVKKIIFGKIILVFR